MQAGGYPYRQNDLAIEEWIDLGQVKQALEPPLTCPLMVRKEQ